MRFKRYLAVMGATSVTAAALVAGFNLLVDPLGISPIRIAIAGFNEWKPLRQDYDRIVKPYDVRRSHPRTIFIGSSRIKQTIDPKLLAGTRFAPAYNAGINGSADYEELNSYLQYYIRADQELRHVFIEAFASAMFSVEPSSRMGTPLKPMMRLGLKEYVADFGSVFFSVNGLNSAMRSAWLNRRRARDHWVLPDDGSWEDGFAPVVLQTNHRSVRNVFNFVLHNAVFHSTGRLDPRIAVAAEAMIADCQRHGVECRFFLSPLHADVLYALYHLNLWPEVEKLKRTLAALAPTFDFTRYNHLIDERTGPVVYWPEAFPFCAGAGKIDGGGDDRRQDGQLAGEFRCHTRREQYRGKSRRLARGARQLDCTASGQRAAHAKGAGELSKWRLVQGRHRRRTEGRRLVGQTYQSLIRHARPAPEATAGIADDRQLSNPRHC